jgi:RHS repeat-associated protein
MTDGTGTTKYEYDQLDRLTETENGHKEVVKYEYSLAGDQTKITYPNGKAVTRAFDKDGRLEKVTDWNSKETKFSYDPDSDLKATVFPSETKDEDTYAYNDADEMSEVKMLKGTETLASLAYNTRDNDGQVKTITSKGLPGEEKPTYEYDTNSRLTKGAGVAYEYDSSNNPTKIGTGTYKYNSGNELETGPSLTYTYNEEGQRTKTKPTTGPATSYGYDQAGNLLSVERPKEGEVAEIKDSYAYNGDGLRVSQTISGTTTYMAWDTAEELPLLLSDGTNSYIYGPGGLPIEQINISTGATTYLHHDQQGSTRLLTGSSGTVTGKCTYSAYGVPTCEGATTTPLGFDGQYTSSDTGLIYLRARTYDPATAQFLSVDADVASTGEPYSYGADNPVYSSDPTGLAFWDPEYIESAQWTRRLIGHGLYGWTLEVQPTDICRAICGVDPGARHAAWNQVKAEVVKKATETGGDKQNGPPSELSKSMYDQFTCHTLSPAIIPPGLPGGKATWNLDTYRPDVSGLQEIHDRCNPPPSGGGHEGDEGV